MSDARWLLYQHEPLISTSSIRVLDLLPSLNPQAPIRCNIRQVELGGPGAGYEALSYVWGERHGSRPIICNSQTLLVTPNCIAALFQLRRPLRTRTLWIDAVCIDQGDDAVATAERNRQVAMMGEVYGSARGVIVWLGPGDEEYVPQIFRYLKLLGLFRYLDLMDTPRALHRTVRRVKPYMLKLAWPGGPGVGRAQGPAFENLLELLGNEWFSRAWTMREIITLGRCTVMCGTSTVDWNYFFVGMRDAGVSYHSRASALLVYLRGNIAGEILDPTESDDDYKNMHDIQLLKAMCKLQCSVPHDKIYGLYSIFCARGVNLPEPDYNRPVGQVLEETARAYVRYKRKLDILRITLPPPEASGLPSWIPNWSSGESAGQLTCSDVTGTVIICFSDFPSTISACRGALTFHTDAVSHVPGKLAVRGKHVGNITSISAGPYIGAYPVKEPSHFRSFISTCREWCRMSMSTRSYPGGEKPLLAGLRTITSHKGFLNGKQLDREDLLLWHRNLVGQDGMSENEEPAKTIVRANRLQPGQESTAENTANAVIMQTVQSHINYRANYALFTLDSGYFGSGFRTCRAGDRVYVLAGLDVPCVMRKKGDEFRFVALAYVYGAMEGQVWPQNEDQLEDLILA